MKKTFSMLLTLLVVFSSVLPISANDKATSQRVAGDISQEVTVSKVDATNSHELAGARLRIKDENGKVVDSWTSNGSEHKFTADVNKVYTLLETSAPRGYLVAEEVPFYVDGENNVFVFQNRKWVKTNKVVMKDERKPQVPNEPVKFANENVMISKVDATNSHELAGARLRIKDENGKVVDSWTSTGTEHRFAAKINKVYTLAEKSAPKGYLVAKEISFYVDEENSVFVSQNGKWVETYKVIMKDERRPQIPNQPTKGKVVISKVDATNGQELAGAQLELEGDNGIIQRWTSDGTAKEFEVEVNVRYTLIETSAPSGYKIADTITFYVDENNNVFVARNGKWVQTDKIVMADERA